jgi:phage-related holin
VASLSVTACAAGIVRVDVVAVVIIASIVVILVAVRTRHVAERALNVAGDLSETSLLGPIELSCQILENGSLVGVKVN